jgi:glycine/D-amino acid oxidase-like deaminating enzyme
MIQAMDIRSNEPYWLLKNGILNSYPSLHRDIETAVLIVGSGITGALMAHACLHEGYPTVLIDKREVVNGSSSATTAMLQYEIDVPLYQLIAQIGEIGAVAAYKGCRDAIYKLEDIVKEVDSSAGFERKESVYFASNKKDLKWLKQEFELRYQYGFKVSWLEREELRLKYGLEGFGAILSEDGASVDAFKLAHDLLHFNAQKGLQVFDKNELVKVKYHENHVIAELDTKAKIKAKKIIYCTGYETQSMLPEKVVNLKSTYAIVSERSDAWLARLGNTLFWNTDAPYAYIRTTADGRLLIGGEDENFKNAVKRDLLLNKKAVKLLKTLKNVLPEVSYFTDFSWCGTFGETKDGLPYIGSHPKFPNSYFVLGFGGNGITFSVLGMDLIIGMMQGNPNLLSHYFRFNR